MRLDGFGRVLAGIEQVAILTVANALYPL